MSKKESFSSFSALAESLGIEIKAADKAQAAGRTMCGGKVLIHTSGGIKTRQNRDKSSRVMTRRQTAEPAPAKAVIETLAQATLPQALVRPELNKAERRQRNRALKQAAKRAKQRAHDLIMGMKRAWGIIPSAHNFHLAEKAFLGLEKARVMAMTQATAKPTTPPVPKPTPAAKSTKTQETPQKRFMRLAKGADVIDNGPDQSAPPCPDEKVLATGLQVTAKLGLRGKGNAITAARVVSCGNCTVEITVQGVNGQTTKGTFTGAEVHAAVVSGQLNWTLYGKAIARLMTPNQRKIQLLLAAWQHRPNAKKRLVRRPVSLVEIDAAIKCCVLDDQSGGLRRLSRRRK